MEVGVFLLQGDNSLVHMSERPYEAESLLQDLLAMHPDLLAGDQMNPTAPRRWLLIEREAGVPANPEGGDWWAVDHLFLDQDAVPTFVEVKRATDTRIRREVVAQMLDYAAHATAFWSADRLRELFARRCTAAERDPANELSEFLGSEGGPEAFWDLAQTNLRDGRVRLLFVADRIPDALRRIVAFLNRQMTPAEVLAVEIRQFAAGQGDGARTLIPRVIGQSEQTRAANAPASATARADPISRGEFAARLADNRREAALAILDTAAACGFAAAPYRNASGVGVRIALDGASLAPVVMDQRYLWVNLGRYRAYAALREPDLNRALRQAILRVSPACTQAADPGKSEVGLRLEAIDEDGRAQLPALFDLLRRGLAGEQIAS